MTNTHYPETTPSEYGPGLSPASTAEYIARAVLDHCQEVLPQLAEYGVVPAQTEILTSHPLTEAGYTVTETDDTMGPVRNFKQRGATAALLFAKERLLAQATVETEELDPGPVLNEAVAASRGGHALGVAYAARRIGFTRAVVETPLGLAKGKREPLRELMTTVHATHKTLEDARDVAKLAGSFYGNTYVDPFDAIGTMAGAASLGHEKLQYLLQAQAKGELDLQKDEVTIFLPAGGGGLAAACASVFHNARQNGLIGKDVKLVLVQMEYCDAIARQRQGIKLTGDELDTSCEGTSVLEPGVMTTEVINDPTFVSDVMVVPREYVAKAMEFLGYPVEPAGALAMAGALYYGEQHGPAPDDGRRHILDTTRTGANITTLDFDGFLHEYTTQEERADAVKTFTNYTFDFEDDLDLDAFDAAVTPRLGGLAVAASPTAGFRSGPPTPHSRSTSQRKHKRLVS